MLTNKSIFYNLDDDCIVSFRVLKVSVGQHLRKTYTHINVLLREDSILLYMYNLHRKDSRHRGVSIEMEYSDIMESWPSAFLIEQRWLL